MTTVGDWFITLNDIILRLGSTRVLAQCFIISCRTDVVSLMSVVTMVKMYDVILRLLSLCAQRDVIICRWTTIV